MALTKIGPVSNFPVSKGVCVDVGGKKIAVFNTTGQYYAIDDACTHDGGPLCEGEVEGTVVTCPWHQATFDLKSGEALGPPAFSGVKCYKVVVEGNDVKVEV